MPCFEELLWQADAALRRARKEGRNRVRTGKLVCVDSEPSILKSTDP